jgi:hypothetical protein
VGDGLTSVERLDGWKAVGIITDAQHSTLTALVRHERFSVFVELSALLYLGVLSVVGGLTWTFREYVTSLGDVAILSILGLLMAAAFGYCFSRAAAYSNNEVESPSLVFDYVVYFGCLVFSLTLGFIETEFGVFQGWDTHLLIAGLVFGGLAYRFDNRFVLSLALSSLAGFIGLRVVDLDAIANDRLRLFAILYGAFLIGIGLLLNRQRIKAHFLNVYLQLGGNIILLAAAFGAIDGPSRGLYLAMLLMLSAAAIYLGIRFERFAFVAYGTVYGYAGISIRALTAIGSPIGGLMYFVLTGTLVVIALVVVARRFGRTE